MQLNFATQGVNFIAFTGYALVYDAQELGDLTAAVNTDLMNVLADKVDPALLDAATQAANSINDLASNVSVS
ncbi:hypothetical protein Patl_0366 [Paraglaciecola sp. T6c]|uniref:hypothetical protein n=1 Tax=Pseudoalteromonas atlantica (strain T6c / ATCC BAA-1087) TaxID=3042615 RepID=UPI00005C6077|nr:hypothetical protein [Paraglaciecola sp. T6c]ABG38897.1 hypothetical protein Patl_0366 [Paraglaciecola sp. T6c]